MSKELSKKYNPKEVEDKIYELWMKGRYFHAKIDKNKKPYTIVIPPPNITGQLHMGHALDETLQDILIRYKRMQGFEALWLPGTDHASIATEAKISETLKKEGISKEKLGREKFLKRAMDWKEKYSGKITDQLKKLGSSCDWDRERFTLDKGCSKAVKEVFVNLFDQGFIYRGERIINWCPCCKTSISDAEVEFTEHDGNFWHLRYPLSDGTGYVELATTRPETLVGDTAVAVNPNDDRYKNLIGKTVKLPLTDREIPIISDDYVDMDFGTGVVKITPAHDFNDFEVGLRHNLLVINVMDDNAAMNENSGKYQGLDRYEARKEILKDLEAGGFLIKTESIKHNIGECYRCSSVIEPKISKQWFMKMNELAKPAIENVKVGNIKFIPERFEKIYFHWMENIKDWCISRQLWWGHRIPAWYCNDCGEITVSKVDIYECPECKSNNIIQDSDTLDTWFSSALWPFSTLGWPEKTSDFEYFYPTNTLVTGYDIIFFWVARMIFSGIKHTGKVPFNTVFLHGMVRDDQGRKMSKSLGNGIDPLEIIATYGADALRFSLAIGISPGNDIRFSKEKVEASRNFANKIWNAARFIMMNISSEKIDDKIPEFLYLNIEDEWIISSLNSLCKDITENIEKFELGIALQKLYDFIWNEFCDWYIEFAKIRIGISDQSSRGTKQVLVYVMTNILKLLHPFMPFITEEIFLTLLPHEKSITISEYPQFKEKNSYKDSEDELRIIMEVIKSIRNRRSEMNIPPSKKAKVYIETNSEEIFKKGKEFIKKLAYVSDIMTGVSFKFESAVIIITNDAKIHIPMNELIDKKEELLRLNKELDFAKEQMDQCENKLDNKTFVQKAPEKVVTGVKENFEKLKDKIKKLELTIKSLQ